MNRNIYNLPNNFFDSSPNDPSIYFYNSNKTSKNNKINFSHNLICILLEGYKELITNDSKYSFKNSDLFILQSGRSLMTEKIIGGNAYKSILLFFSDSFLLNFIRSYKLLTNNCEAIDKRVAVFKKDNYLINYENSLLLLNDLSIINTDQLLKNKLEEILLYLYQSHKEEFLAIAKTIIYKVKHKTFMEIIYQNSTNNLTIEQLSFLCNMSPSTFKRKFMELYQTSPKKYFIKQRMNQSIVLLQQDLKPSEIYFQLGYENLSAFSTEFKKYFGVSPKDYQLII